MKDYSHHILQENQPVRDALARINELEGSLTLFILNETGQMTGTLTDGDIRRGLLRDLTLSHPVAAFMNRDFMALRHKQEALTYLDRVRNAGVHLLPLLGDGNRLLRVIDLRQNRSYLPIEAIIMAGGRGERLRPYTDSLPKPLLPVGDKPIIEHNVDRLISYGISRMHLSIRYLGHLLKEHFGDGSKKGVSISYITEDEPLGTIGAVRRAEAIESDYVLVMNSDLLTNIDFEDLFRSFIEQEADFMMATTPYEVKVPYAVIETEGDRIRSFREKPTYTYYSNAGIYLFRREFIDLIPENSFFNATDLVDALIAAGKKVSHFPILGYWLDIGQHDEYKKAQEDIRHLEL